MEMEKNQQLQHDDESKRQRKTTLCCLTEDKLNKCDSNKWIIVRFVCLFFVSLLILCCVYGLKSNGGGHHKENLNNFYAVGDPVYARDLWLVVELASDDRGRRTREGKEAAAHACSAIQAAQAIGWTPLIVGARSPCCRSSRCRHLHPKDLERMNYTLSGHYHRHGQTRMALKTAGFLAAIERGAHFIFQANPEVYYRAGLTPKQYQVELERQLRKTTLGISVGLLKSFAPNTKSMFDPYGHFGQTFQQIGESDNNINQYKICEVKPPSIEKFLDTDGKSLDLSAPAFTIPGGRIGAFDTRNTAFGRDIFAGLFLFPEGVGMNEKDQYFIRSLMANVLLKASAGSSKFSVSEISTMTAEDIAAKTPLTKKYTEFVSSWECTDYTVLRCMQALGGALLRADLIDVRSLELLDMWVSDLKSIGYEDIKTVQSFEAQQEPCIGQDALKGVYFHPSVRIKEYEHRSRQGKILVEDFEHQLKKSESFASRMLKRLCPSVDLKTALANYNQYDPHDNILLIVTFYKKDYHNIPLLEIMYRHHFKNILYCGEPDEVVDEYMKHYNGESGTYFSFLPVHHKQSAGYECLLGAIEMGYIVEGFLLVNEDTLVNSWNFGEENLPTTQVWHGNEHAMNVTLENLESLETDPQEIMRSMLGILQAFQFLENVLLSENPSKTIDTSTSAALQPPPPLIVERPKANHHAIKRQVSEEGEEDDFSEEEMIMMHESDTSHDSTDHEMSIVDDHENGTTKEWHINLFGEIVHDEPEQDQIIESSEEDLVILNERSSQAGSRRPVNISAHEVSELLFHPANFDNDDGIETNGGLPDIKQEHFNDMMYNIKSIYKRIHDKLNLWIRFKKMRMKPHDEVDHEEMKTMKKELDHLNCNKATNAEICHLVASFFTVLDSNEGDNFQLVYDDLPIYYVPERLKERLYLMSNLFTKFQITDRLAFPLLLRGLDKTDSWTKLTRAELSALETTQPIISRPQDLLSEALDDKIQTLEEVEAAHYLYPVDVKAVLTNEDLRTVVCRNF